MKTIDAYKKILKVIESCTKEVKLDSSIDTSYKLKSLILREEIQENFGIDLSNCYDYSATYFKVGYDKYIAKYSEKENRTISWPDDGKQPKDEWLLAITYPPGAYIFGDDYQESTFNNYFEELKSFNPKYIDSANHCLYYTDDVAKVVFDQIGEIFKKYQAIAEDNRKASKIEALKKQLEELEGANE